MDGLESADADFAQIGYRFGEFRLEANGALLRGDTPVELPLKELAVLRLLLARRGQVVTSLELKTVLSGDQSGAAEGVAKCLASLRRRLEPAECIETIYKRGYRFSIHAEQLVRQAPAALPRLVILPFNTDHGAMPFLGMAMVQGAGGRLSTAQSPVVSVAAWDSVVTLAQRGFSAQRVGAMLNADYVLRGTLHALSLHYRLRVEMIRVEDGSPMWVEDMLLERSRVAELEIELARLVAARMNSADLHSDFYPDFSSGLAIAAAAAPDEGGEHTDQVREAYETLQRARYEWQTLERHRMQDGLQHLLRALELDPDSAAPRADLCNLCVTQALMGFMPAAISADMAQTAAETMPDLLDRAEAMLPALGWISFHFDRDLPEALQLFALSAHLPHDSWITQARTMFALSRHRFGEAIELLQQAIEADPFSAVLHARLAWAHHLAGEYDASIQHMRTALDRFPGHDETQIHGAAILAFQGETKRAIALAQDLAQRKPYLDSAAAVHACALAAARQTDEARTILDRLKWLAGERYVLPSFLAPAYTALGEHDAALAALQSADRQRCPWFFQMLADPRLKPLQERAEFQSMRGILTGMEAGAKPAAL